MAHTIAWVKVADFDRFLETFTTRGKDKRGQSGSRGSVAYRTLDDPNRVVVVFDWDQEEFEAFRADPEAQEVMAAAGVEEIKAVHAEQVAELSS